MTKVLSAQELIQKINQLKAAGTVDLSTEEDLSLAVMNLVSLEEHFFFTAEKTGRDEYFALLNQTREIRKQLLGKMIDHHEGETWCISKHLLAAVMRLMEVGTKLQSQGKKPAAREMFDKAYEIYLLFWALRLKLITTAGLKKISERQLNKHDRGKTAAWSRQDIISKLLDCCNE